RAGRCRSSPVFIAWRMRAEDSLRAARWAAACSLRERWALARARAAASASLRVGVGRPLPPGLGVRGAGAVSDLVRRNNGDAFSWVRMLLSAYLRPVGR